MWRTSHGDRVLEGDEARVFLEAVGFLRDMLTVAVEFDDSYPTGVEVYDALHPAQQMMCLHRVTTALILPSVPAPALSAVLEGTVYAIFLQLNEVIALEIESSRQFQCDHYLRQLVVSSLNSPIVNEEEWHDADRQDSLISSQEADLDVWSELIEELADRVLWDRDFAMDAIVADLDPLRSAQYKAILGIDTDYFANAAPDAHAQELQRIDQEIVDLRVKYCDQIHERGVD
ncbi:MAG: hypothetical protein AAFN77_08005 [Planctomycetota bacterium]